MAKTNKEAQKEILKRIRAKKDFKSFVLLKWERYECKVFKDNWHYDYLCRILESTLPKPSALGSHLRDCENFGATADLMSSSTPKFSQNTQSTANPRSLDTKNELFCDEKLGFSSEQARSLLGINDAACERRIHDLSRKAEAFNPLITRLMLNMPPSYGKTEIIARCFIAWALGNFPQRKFIYISYSDELCRKISNQVRDLLKSPFYALIFGKSPQFLQDNANEFVLKEGGGLFVTTLKSAITGFHAHQILIDDPIKVSAMNSKAERNLVNQNFKESVLSRLQDNESNITILMQRLGDEDLCGFLLNEKNFDKATIAQWKQISLKALNQKQEHYAIGDFSYTRKANEPLFPARHNLSELEHLRLQMGNDEFSTQYQQEPMVSQAGFFEEVYFQCIPSYECSTQYLYIFVDNAISISESADNRAIVLIGAESHKDATRYVVRDCAYGIWDEEQTLKELISMMSANPSAKVYIESDGGGLILERLLLTELVKINSANKLKNLPQITNTIKCYTPSRKISKVEKIKAMRPFYNTGFLVFLHNARGLSQIKTELLGFNPSKPFRKDDCIDCIASAIAHNEVIAPALKAPQSSPQSPIEKLRKAHRVQRVSWNI